jgi:AraC-like DNA-binding protein
MHFEFNFRSSLLLVFFIHLLVYAFLYIRRSILQENLADRILGWFIIVSALFIIPWMTGFAGWYDNQPYRDILFYTPFVHGFFLGPLLFLYVKSITNFKFTIQKSDWLHFVPGILYLIWSVVLVVTDKVVMKKYYFMVGLDPDFEGWYTYSWLVSLMYYLFLTIRFYLKYRQFIDMELSFAEAASFKWIRNVLYAFALITTITILLKLLSFFVDVNYGKTWYYYLLFAIIAYYIAISGYSAGQVPLRRLRFEPQLLESYRQPLLLSPSVKETIDINHEIVTQEPENEPAGWLDEWKQKLDEVMETGKVYEEPELTLSELAKKLKTNTSVLSKVINQRFGKSFNDYINEYRVNDIKKKLADPKYKNQTILGIAFDAGFNSKSTFNRSFKKIAGISPKDYISQLDTSVKS